MTILETVLFSGNAELDIYVLSDEDELGRKWDISRWTCKGNGEIRILKAREEGGNIRCTMKASNSDQILTNHLVHPDSILKSTKNGCGRMLWVMDEPSPDVALPRDTCIELTFESQSEATEFERQYISCQETMERLHKHTEENWRYKPVEKIKKSCVPEAKKDTIAGEMEGKTSSLYPFSEDQEHGSETDDEECSEISLEETDEEDAAFAASKPMKIPSFSSQKKLWKCNACTTPNPEEASKCLCCETARDAMQQTKTSGSRTIPPLFSGMKKEEQKSVATFDFTGKTAQGGLFGTGISPTTTGQDSEPVFSFATTSKQDGKKHDYKLAVHKTKDADENTGSSTSELCPSGSKAEDKATEPELVPNSKSLAQNTQDKLSSSTVESAKDPELSESSKVVVSSYPPMETMKKVESKVPSQPQSSAYPPMETMKKVESKVPSQSQSSAYPPMETMKKVESKVPTQSTKPSYPPMETLKRVDQPFVKTSEEKTPETKKSEFKSSIPDTTSGLRKQGETDQENTDKGSGHPAKAMGFGLTSTFGVEPNSPFGMQSGSLFSAAKDASPGLFSSKDAKSGSSIFGNIGGARTLFGDTEKPKSMKDALISFYREYKPENLQKVDSLLEKFKGRDADLINNISLKYNLPEDKKQTFFGFVTSTSENDPNLSFGETPKVPAFSGFSSLGSKFPQNNGFNQPRDSDFKAEADDDDDDEEQNSSEDDSDEEENDIGSRMFGSGTAISSAPTFSPATLTSNGFGFVQDSIKSEKNPTTPLQSGGPAPEGLYPPHGSSSSVSFGQSSLLGAPDVGGFVVTPTPEKQETKGLSNFGGEKGGFASFAGNDKGTGFTALASQTGGGMAFKS